MSSPTLIEGDFCSIEELYNVIDNNDYIICLGLGCRSIDEVIVGIRKNDREKDYTNEWSDEKIKSHFYNLEEIDKDNYDFCTSHNIKYYDTYEDRQLTFTKIIEDINNYYIC